VDRAVQSVWGSAVEDLDDLVATGIETAPETWWRTLVDARAIQALDDGWPG
jgi:hypothetical protein